MKQVREGYKMTELGEIPVEWEVVDFFKYIDSILDFRGRTPKKLGMDWGNGKIRALSANNVKMGYIDFSAECYLASNELYSKWMTKGDLEKDDILFTMEAPLGNVAQVPDSNRYILSQRVVAFKTNEKLNNNYFKYQLMSDSFRENLEKNATGTTAKGISQKNLSQLSLVIPGIQEQQKIAEILSKVDEQIENTEQLIKKTKELKKGLMQQLLTKGIGHTEFKQTELGEIPVEWKVKKLEQITTKIGDGIHSTPKYDPEGTYAFVNGNNIKKSKLLISDTTKYINDNEFSNYKQYLNENTILLSINGTIGNLGVYNGEKVLLGKSIAFINVTEDICKQFLFYFLSSNEVQSYFTKELTGTTIKNLSLKTIRETSVCLPTLEEQQKIASILSSVDEQIESYEQEKEKYLELKKGLMQQLLTGQMRVTV